MKGKEKNARRRCLGDEGMEEEQGWGNCFNTKERKKSDDRTYK
jgi:hypothetical protein